MQCCINKCDAYEIGMDFCLRIAAVLGTPETPVSHSQRKSLTYKDTDLGPKVTRKSSADGIILILRICINTVNFNDTVCSLGLVQRVWGK